jgi:hypothetical protein
MKVSLKGTLPDVKDSVFSFETYFLVSLSYKAQLSLEEYDIIEKTAVANKDEFEILQLDDVDSNKIKNIIQSYTENVNRLGFIIVARSDDSTLLNLRRENSLLRFGINPDLQFLTTDFGRVYMNVRKQLQLFLENIEFVPVMRGSFNLLSPQYQHIPQRISEGVSAPDEFLNLLIFPDYITEERLARIAHWAKEFGVSDFEAVIQPDYKVEGRGWVFDHSEKIPLTLYGFGSIR